MTHKSFKIITLGCKVNQYESFHIREALIGAGYGEVDRNIEADVVLVLGSQNSSNSQRLKELAKDRNVTSHLIDGSCDIDANWFKGDETVLITAGASAPESVVQECVSFLRDRYGAELEARSIREERVHFQLPKELRDTALS